MIRAGQMQQRPAAEGGGRIKREWFGFFRLVGGVRPDIDEHDTGSPRPAFCEKSETITIFPRLRQSEVIEQASI
jgi:hypothetical protein